MLAQAARTGEAGLRRDLTPEEAISLLKPSETVHCFIANGALIGADWSRASVIEHILAGKPELAGPSAASMGHGLAVITGNEAAFFETDDKKLAAFEAAQEGPPC